MEILTVDELPPVVRGSGSRNAEERAKVLESLTDGKAHIIPNIEDRQAHNRLQQRIRNLAKSNGIAVRVQYDPALKQTSFQGSTEVPVKESNTKSAKASASKSE